ncbi:hypertrehalosaemic prohormone-like [Osmia bicornis bicornis]|uniref:hypertrehalosaemic prohormone-like n=1 Tax=Osmia bicornis bicornis TaxID=1437191 RepID=UPI0010F53D30|nr:hypertrehalosaemic prohormone-like [Osmia bicornis bicornis]
MYRKIQLSFLAIVFLLCLSFELGADAQLNFSTGWGKRSQQRVSGFERANGECIFQAKPSLEQLLIVYNIIQTEAKKMMDCRKLYE